MRPLGFLGSLIAALACAGCGPGQPAAPTPQPFTALHVVTSGPYPLYAEFGEWELNSAGSVSIADAEKKTIEAGRIARAQHRLGPDAGPWLLRGCIFDVLGTRADEQDGSYVWAFGRVVRCAEEVEDSVLEPQMGVRPNKLRVYDGFAGYFPMNLLDRYAGQPQR